MVAPTSSASSSSVSWLRAWSASSAWMTVRAPVFARTRFAARE
jgi:hypothetical protein